MNETRVRRILTGLLFVLVGAASAATAAPGPQQGQARCEDLYSKREAHVPMRDGVELFCSIYEPRDRSREYGILLCRTPYSCRPYGPDAYRPRVGPSRYAMDHGFIIVYQDVRGRWMSDGRYDNMRPHVAGDPVVDGKPAIDESSDTYDTIEWLLAHVENHNGKVGIWGISYPGFYAAAALPEHHPALVCASPQAPIGDFFFDDFHHQGAFLLSYFLATAVFGYQKEGRTTESWYSMVRPETPDGYQFYLELGALSNASEYYGQDNEFWTQIVEHPNYDEFWQARSIVPHLQNVDTAVMTVGGWFDAEDLYGPLNIYRELEARGGGAFNMLVMGPWGHGDWAREREVQVCGDVVFGEDLSTWYQTQVELPFFRHFLEGAPAPDLPEALLFDTGVKEWRKLDRWPPAVDTRSLYLRAGGALAFGRPREQEAPFATYLSDPAKPVPYTEDVKVVFTPRSYMAEDQRFASRRPDVLVYQTPVLEEDLTVAGEIFAHLQVSTTANAADWVVKLIDVYPGDTPDDPRGPDGVRLGGMQQMVRSEVMRARFRNGHHQAEPMVPGVITEVTVPLQDVLHTFKKGHRIMIHVQSTWFPLIDRNPQRFVPNIYQAKDSDFLSAMHRVYHSPAYASHLEFRTL